MMNNFSLSPPHRDKPKVKVKVVSCVCPHCGKKQDVEFVTFPWVLEVLRGTQCVRCHKRFYASAFGRHQASNNRMS